MRTEKEFEDATEFRHKFATEYYTQVSDDCESEDCYDVDWVYTNGLRAYTDDDKIYFKDFKLLSTIECNELEAVLVLRTNDVVRGVEQGCLEEWAENGFEDVGAIILKEDNGYYHYLIPRLRGYIISYGYATCEDCIKDYLESLY